MCVTLHDASLGRTTIAGWRNHPRRTHVLAYGNEPRNRAGVPNAMILHIPVAYGAVLAQANFLPGDGTRHLLEDMWKAAPKWQQDETLRQVAPRPARKGTVSVFDMGSYTWVAATQADAVDITAALRTVRLDRRPAVSQGLIEFYQRTWPYDALAIGCFSTDSGSATEPAVIEYPPQDWGILRFPATDAHGLVPSWGGRVMVNHRLIVGTSEFGLGGRPAYRNRDRMDPRLTELLPSHVVGAELLRIPMIQGDFYVNFDAFDKNSDIFRAHGPVLTNGAERIPVLTGAGAGNG